MKKLLTVLALIIMKAGISQDCVDESLIDLNAICPMIYAPVCGCNGVTYDNDCLAIHLGGVTSWTDGACTGTTECMDLGGLDFGMCDMYLGIAFVDGNCVGMSGCGYMIGDIDYSPFFFSNLTECQQSCGNVATDCINLWQIEQGYLVDCGDTPDTVCGCDGNEYVNPCLAYFAGGVTHYSLGNCNESGCFTIPLYIDFGDCEMALGFASTAEGCVSYSGCSYIGQNGYDYSNLFYQNFDDCLLACSGSVVCVDSSLIDTTMGCLMIYDPVCGCNDSTYSNSCVATYYGGVTSYTPGECPSNLVRSEEIRFDIFPNPVTDILNISSNHSLNGSLTITDISARIVLIRNVYSNVFRIDLSELISGIYTLNYTDETGISRKEIFIKI